MIEGSAPVRLLLIDDHPVVTAGLVAVLESDPGVEVVGVASTVAEAEEKAKLARPEVVLVDFQLPDGTGADAVRSIRAGQPDVAAVFLTGDTSQSNLMAAIDAGACGFLPKSTGPRAIVDAVLRAAAGEMLIPAATLAEVIRAKTAQARVLAERGRDLDRFTARELEILALMAAGLDNTAIGRELKIGVNTVRWHVQRMLEKLDAHSKLEAVARATELGLLERS
jgi:DNA-binding NarL/FixJ family response regulator